MVAATQALGHAAKVSTWTCINHNDLRAIHMNLCYMCVFRQVGGTLMADFVEREISTALEWLETDHYEHR